MELPPQPNLCNNCSNIEICTEQYKNEVNSDGWCDLKPQKNLPQKEFIEKTIAQNDSDENEMTIENKYITQKIAEEANLKTDTISEVVKLLLEIHGGAFCFNEIDIRNINISRSEFRKWCQNAAWRGEIDFIQRDGRWWVGKKDITP